MKHSLIILLAALGIAPLLHAQEAPMDATHLGLRVFVPNAFAAVQKADETPQYPKGTLTKADLYSGVAAGIRVRGKACANVTEAHAMDANGEKIEVICADGGSYVVQPLTGGVQGK